MSGVGLGHGSFVDQCKPDNVTAEFTLLYFGLYFLEGLQQKSLDPIKLVLVFLVYVLVLKNGNSNIARVQTQNLFFCPTNIGKILGCYQNRKR